MKKLHMADVSTAVQAAFLNELHVLQIASACHCACRMLGCFKLENDPCIVMSQYATSAAARLEQMQGDALTDQFMYPCLILCDQAVPAQLAQCI